MNASWTSTFLSTARGSNSGWCYRFTLLGSSVDGALTRDIWGDLDFKYVSINYNKITDVDNGAFIGSSERLISLNLGQALTA